MSIIESEDAYSPLDPSLQCYGHLSKENQERMARQGVLFSRHRAPITWRDTHLPTDSELYELFLKRNQTFAFDTT